MSTYGKHDGRLADEALAARAAKKSETHLFAELERSQAEVRRLRTILDAQRADPDWDPAPIVVEYDRLHATLRSADAAIVELSLAGVKQDARIAELEALTAKQQARIAELEVLL